MKTTSLFASLLLSGLWAFAQPSTEVFLFDLKTDQQTLALSNFKNVSTNEGYDNQPSFMDNNTLFYAGTRNGQTDIVKYNIRYDSKVFINHTEGSEYSPLKIPGKRAVSAIRLDKNGDQKLYQYSLRNGESNVLIEDIIIGYHVWVSPDLLVSSVLENERLALYTTKLSSRFNQNLHGNIGRSLHKIPHTEWVSFIDKTNPNAWEIKRVNPLNGDAKTIATTLPNSEDMCWLPDGSILMGHDSKLYRYTPEKSKDWKEVADLKALNIKNITRLAISPNGKKLALVGELMTSVSTETNTSNTTPKEDPSTLDAGAIVQKHIGPYNSGDLNAFANAFSETVVVRNFPNRPLYNSRKTLLENYQRFHKNNTNLGVHVNKRIVHNAFVIDEELATVNYETHRQATIYTTSKNGIESMTFIQNKPTNNNPEFIVNAQLEAYNKRDIDAFMSTYTDDITLYNYPHTKRTEGQSAMRQGYQSWFERNPNLKATVVNRIVVGNYVIDQEEVETHQGLLKAIAIYEVENNKIKSVTFIQ